MIQEKKNSTVFLRPRFSLEIDKDAKEVLKIVEERLLESIQKFSYKITDQHVFIDISTKESHFWSPQLHLEVLALSTKTSLIKGLFGPKPQVWTFFMFLHFVVGICFFAFATMLYVNYTLDKSLLFPLLMVIVLPVVWVLLYLIGRLGRDFGRKQMKELHDFLLAAIG